MPAPRPLAALDQDIAHWAQEGIEVIASLIEEDEIGGLEAEGDLCREAGLEFISFPIADKGVPDSDAEAAELARLLAQHVSSGRPVAIHCRAGIGRASLIAAAVLICLDVDAETALAMITEARGVRVPETDGQRQWVKRFQELLACK